MKSMTKKTRTSRRRRPDPEPEEDIFNPFAPLLRGLRRLGRKNGEAQKHPFRDTFITVVLIHVIGVLGFLAFGAVKDSTKRITSSLTPQKNGAAQISRMLGAQSQLLETERAQPGEQLVAVREPDPFKTKEESSPKSAEQSKSQPSRSEPVARSTVPVAATEDPLPPISAPLKAKAHPGKHVAMPTSKSSDPIKEAFLVATGRTPAVAPMPAEVRRAEPVQPVALPTQTVVASSQPGVQRADNAYTGAKQYTVTRGDNAYLISSRLGVSYAELAAANNLSSPRDLRVGQTLVVPRTQSGSM